MWKLAISAYAAAPAQHARHSHGPVVLDVGRKQEVWHGSKSGEGGFLHSPLLEELKSLELNLGAPGVRPGPALPAGPQQGPYCLHTQEPAHVIVLEGLMGAGHPVSTSRESYTFKMRGGCHAGVCKTGIVRWPAHTRLAMLRGVSARSWRAPCWWRCSGTRTGAATPRSCPCCPPWFAGAHSLGAGFQAASPATGGKPNASAAAAWSCQFADLFLLCLCDVLMLNSRRARCCRG